MTLLTKYYRKKSYSLKLKDSSLTMVDFSSYSLLQTSVNKELTIKGRISTIIWQHMVGFFDGYPNSEYFDLEDGFQTIIYTKEKIETAELIAVTGKVIEITGRAKRPTDSEDIYKEYHILVDSYILVKN